MPFNLDRILFSIPAIIIGLTVHEYFHAFTAFKLGDSTAHEDGRVSFNPFKHIDPFGMILIVLLGFGWAKPVKFNPHNLKNPKQDRILIAIAGPISNLILGLISLILLKTFIFLNLSLSSNIYELIWKLLLNFSYINLGLFIFNMIPIPPLDGSHVLFSMVRISPSVESAMVKYGFIFLIAVLFIQSRSSITILPIRQLIDLIVGLFFK